MKNLITLIGCVLILLAMFLQIAQNQITYNRLANVDSGVTAFKDKLALEGCITKDNANWLKNYIATKADCNYEDVIISGTDSPLPKGDLVHYVVEVKLSKLLAAKEFWGFDKSDDTRIYKIDRYVVSQKESKI